MINLTRQQEQTLREALEHYGIEEQTQMLYEEMAELQNALCKLRRSRAIIPDVTTELADVIIMCLQLAHHYGESDVQREIDNKIDRLKHRLEHFDKCP